MPSTRMCFMRSFVLCLSHYMPLSTPVPLTSAFSLNHKQKTPQYITLTITDTCITLLCAKLCSKCFTYAAHLILTAYDEAGIIMICVL